MPPRSRLLPHALALLVAIAGAAPARAQVEEPDINFFYPAVTRRVELDREIEFKLRHEKSREGRRTEVAGSFEWPLTSWWQVELEVPLAVRDPRADPATAGAGDLALQNRFLFFKSVEHRILLGGGFELTLPSGSGRRGLGGEFTVEPFLAGGIALGPFDVLANVGYQWNLTGGIQGQREQEMTANLAVGYLLHRSFTPYLELNAATMTSGPQPDDGPKLRDRAQLYLTPGFNVRPLPGLILRAGIQLPVSDARKFDYALHGGIVWEF